MGVGGRERPIGNEFKQKEETIGRNFNGGCALAAEGAAPESVAGHSGREGPIGSKSKQHGEPIGSKFSGSHSQAAAGAAPGAAAAGKDP